MWIVAPMKAKMRDGCRRLRRQEGPTHVLTARGRTKEAGGVAPFGQFLVHPPPIGLEALVVRNRVAEESFEH